jgi:hypothetical protein
MRTRMMSAIGVGLLVAATSGFAVPIVTETWTDAGTAGWESDPDPTLGGAGYGTLANPGGAGTVGSLGITGGDGAPGPLDYINLAGAPFAGNYATLGATGVRGIHFDFYVASATVPSALQLYFVGLGGDIWFYNLTAQLATGWNTIGANFNASSPSDMFGSWVQYPEFLPNDGAWTSDITSVSRIGLELRYLSGVGGQIYGVDNFTLDDQPFLVPEPETYVVLGIALLSMAFVFRKRITDSLAEARAMIQM